MTGDPALDQRIEPEPNSGCWLWVGCIDKDGYGEWRKQRAHRVVRKLLIGPLTTDTTDHLCRVRQCVNPWHTEETSRGENVKRGVGLASRWKWTHCANGHEFTPDNIYGYNGRRRCRTCELARRRLRYAASA